jgi:hypothetical protein
LPTHPASVRGIRAVVEVLWSPSEFISLSDIARPARGRDVLNGRESAPTDRNDVVKLKFIDAHVLTAVGADAPGLEEFKRPIERLNKPFCLSADTFAAQIAHASCPAQLSPSRQPSETVRTDVSYAAMQYGILKLCDRATQRTWPSPA